MAEVLGWDEAATAREVEIYRERVAAERRSQEQPDDRAADLERTSAPDVLARRVGRSARGLPLVGRRVQPSGRLHGP